MSRHEYPAGFQEMLQFGLFDALLGRKSRRFFRGAHIPDGVFAYQSSYDPLALSRLETMLVVAAVGGNTSWSDLIYRGPHYAPHLSNYAGTAHGRTFPSAAGFHVSKTFFTNDDGLFVVDDWEAARPERGAAGEITPDAVVEALQSTVRTVHEGRLRLPPEVPFVEQHNTWVVNKPGTLLVMPVADLAQHMILNLLYMLQNNLVLFDDINGRAIPGIEDYADMVDVNNVWPITFVEQWSLSEVTAELSTSCYAGSLALQAMGLGGWMFNGIDPFALLGASGDPAVPGLGFRYDADDRWPYPNVTGLEGVMEGHTIPHFATMRDAVDAVCERKFGPGGPFNAETPGPWKDTPKVRSAAQVHDERFRQCVALQAQYLFDTFGKFPATVPAIFCITYLQAHHLDLEFYDRFFESGYYLQTHADHMRNWHPEIE